MSDSVREIRRILFIRTDRIGDCLMNLPAIRVLRQSFPKAWISCLVDESVAALLKDHPDLDECMPISASHFRKSFLVRWKCFQTVKKARFDLAVISNPDKQFHCLSFLTGIPQRIGKNRKWGFLLTKKIADNPRGSDCHEIENNLKIVKLISDGTWDGKISLPVSDADAKAVEDFLRKECPGEHGLLVVHAGTSDPEKRWPVEKFAALCDKLHQENRSVILIGGPEETGISRELVSQSRIPPLDWTGRLTLKQLVALFSHHRVRALVSSDSGPVHIAWISGTPVVAMYAKNTLGSNPARWGPRDGRSETIWKPMSAITVDEVYALVTKTIEKDTRR